MNDLYSTLFYKIKYTIQSKNEQDDLLWKVVIHIKNWMCNKHNRQEESLPSTNSYWTSLKNGGQITGKSIKITSASCYVEEPFSATFWGCRIIEFPKPDTGFAPRQWVTEIGFEPISPNQALFSCIISFSDRPGFIGKCADNPYPSIPKLIINMWNDSDLICQEGIDKPQADPIKMESGDWLDFWDRVKRPDRTLPYIYVSPHYKPENDVLTLVDPQQLAIAAGGNAIVYYSNDLSITDEMNYFCPSNYKCYGGAIRVYYPNIDETVPGDAYRHRYISADFIDSVGQTELIQIIRRAFAQDVHFYDSFFRVEDCQAKREAAIRKRRLEELKKNHLEELEAKDKQHTEVVKTIEENALSFAEEAERKQLEAEDIAKHYDEENRQLKEENYNLRTEKDSLLLLAKENADLRKVCENRLATKTYPRSPLEIVNYFDASFGDKLAFSEEAFDSISDCSILPEELWKVFFALATTMSNLYINGNGDIYKEFRNTSGIDVSRSEGSMTRQDKKLMRQFEIDYHGETIDIEPHVTYPKIGQSIHFGFSKKEQRIVVGWCGNHKDNYSTQKVH